MSKQRIQSARRLIEEGRIDAARMVLEQVTDPETIDIADEMLHIIADLEDRESEEQVDVVNLLIFGGAVLGIAITLAVLFFAVRFFQAGGTLADLQGAGGMLYYGWMIYQ